MRGWRASWRHGVPDAHHHRLNHGQAEEGRDGGIDSVSPLANEHAPDFIRISRVTTYFVQNKRMQVTTANISTPAALAIGWLVQTMPLDARAGVLNSGASDSGCTRTQCPGYELGMSADR